MICQVYRSPKRDEMYLYLPADVDPQDLPEDLLKSFGAPQPALRIRLTPERRLARVSASDVLQAIEAHGFYLQMPPNPLAGR